MKTIIRVKRRADEEPAESILVKCKYAKLSKSSACAVAKPTVLERVTTVHSLEEELDFNLLEYSDIYKKVKEPKTHYKEDEAEERKNSKKRKIEAHTSHEENLDDIELGNGEGARSKERKLKKLIQKSESVDEAEDYPKKSSSSEINYLDVESIHQGDDVILCNDEPMQSKKYVYDIYYASEDIRWTEYACDIQKHNLVQEISDNEENYEEDDENDENNWRNDYPEEDDEDEEYQSSTRSHPDDSSDEDYDNGEFDDDGNLICRETYTYPVLRLTDYMSCFKFESDCDDD